jgi:hypothetical protein
LIVTGTLVWEIHFTDTTTNATYRAHRYEWNPCARPTGNLLSSGEITNSTATIHWSNATNAAKYIIEFRPVGSFNWNVVNSYGINTSFELTGLSPSTQYEWRIQSVCDEMGSTSAYSTLQNFTTQQLTTDTLHHNTSPAFSVYPNPAHNELYIQLDEIDAINFHVVILNTLGQRLFENEMINTSGGKNIFYTNECF